MDAIQEPLAHFAEHDRLAFLLGVSDLVRALPAAWVTASRVAAQHFRCLDDRNVSFRPASQEPEDDGVLEPADRFNLPTRRPAPGTPEFEAVLERLDDCIAYARENVRFGAGLRSTLRSRSLLAAAAVQGRARLRRQILAASPEGASPAARPRAGRLLHARCRRAASSAGACATPSRVPAPPPSVGAPDAPGAQTNAELTDQAETRYMVVRWRSLAHQVGLPGRLHRPCAPPVGGSFAVAHRARPGRRSCGPSSR